MTIDKNEITSIAYNVTSFGNQNGRPFIGNEAQSALSPQDAEFYEILEVLDAADYRLDFRNLLPWRINSIDSIQTDNGQTAIVLLVWGSEAEECCYLYFHSNGNVAVAAGTQSGFSIYHCANKEIFENL